MKTKIIIILTILILSRNIVNANKYNIVDYTYNNKIITIKVPSNIKELEHCIKNTCVINKYTTKLIFINIRLIKKWLASIY